MDNPTYSFRLSLARKEAAFRLTEQALAWNEAGSEHALAFSDIRQIRIYDSPGANDMPAFTRCTIKPAAGRAVILGSNHYAGLVDWQSRTDSFRPFVDALLRRAALANPGIEFISGMPGALWAFWIAIVAGGFIVAPLVVAAVIVGGKDISAGSLGALAVCVAMLAGFFPLLKLVGRNRPQRFEAREGYPAE